MSTANFKVTEHTSPCSFIRQFPHSAKRDDAELKLAVKEYRHLRDGTSPAEDAVTIIAAHGNGFPKECFEPLWDELSIAVPHVTIDSIWAADMQHQGASYALNAQDLGDDPGWFDHSLDLLLMINRFRNKMKPPFIGVGHSMGCTQIAYLASVHPRLFHCVVFIDPVMYPSHPDGPNAAMLSSLRRETWDSRANAEAHLGKNPFFQSMDPRVLSIFLAHALTDRPDGSVRLSTPKAQEAWSYLRSCFHTMSEDTAQGRQRERMLNPDVDPLSQQGKLRMMRPETITIWDMLPHLRPQTLYIYGQKSHINVPEVRMAHASQTGTGRGGAGGVKDGGTVQKVMQNCGHMCVFEKPREMAKVVAEWLGPQVARWKQEREFWSTVDTGKSHKARTELSNKWIAAVREDKAVERWTLVKTAKL